MSELWICREQTAKKPFCVDFDGTKIYNIEELCFYLYRNMEYLDESIMCAPLYSWLKDEVGLPKLAATIETEQKQGRDVLWCAWFLLREVGMYSDEELAHMKTTCLAVAHMDAFERQKLRADRLFLNRRYLRSIREYEKLIRACEEHHRCVRLLGDIWHNKGAAHAGLFLFQEAAECFLKAYELNHSPKSKQAYEDAVSMKRECQNTPELSECPKGTGADLVEEQKDWELLLGQLQEDYKKKVI